MRNTLLNPMMKNRLRSFPRIFSPHDHPFAYLIDNHSFGTIMVQTNESKKKNDEKYNMTVTMGSLELIVFPIRENRIINMIIKSIGRIHKKVLRIHLFISVLQKQFFFFYLFSCSRHQIMYGKWKYS